jgi:hypothetical protein
MPGREDAELPAPVEGDKMSTEEYNGWTNRETWAVALHLNNDAGLQTLAQEIVNNAYEADQRIWEAATALQNSVESLLDPEEYRNKYGGERSRGLELMAEDCGSLWRVNWDEIVTNMLEDTLKAEITCVTCGAEFDAESMIEDIYGNKYCLLDSGDICPNCGVLGHKCESAE